MSEWSHLANAKHIDLIIAHAKAHPAAWEAACDMNTAYRAAWDAAWDAAYDAACDVNTAAYDAACYADYGAVARDAILALEVWDWAGGLMDSSAEQVKVLAILGDRAAILMYPAIATMETTQELA